MNISFQGFKNAGVQNFESYNRTGEIRRTTILNFELTNTAEGDLDSFRGLIEIMANPVNHNFLS